MGHDLELKVKIEEVGPHLYRYFCTIFPFHVADDLVQETLIRLLGKIRDKRFDPRKGNLRMYAFGIAHFVRLEFLRSSSQHFEPLEDETHSSSPLQDEQLDQFRRIEQLQKAIRTLSEAQQQVIGLYINNELSYEEISAALNIPVGTIKSHVSRAKEALALILSREVK